MSETNFWARLPVPFFCLAPMEDVTDAAFRRLIARTGKPHVMYAEFTSADGLVLAPESGQTHLRRKLLYAPEERPIVAQLFSAYPDRMERAAAIVAEMGFDGIDINMGCPDKAIEKGRCGAAMIRHPDLACEIIRAARRGATGLPVSVKTRIGYNTEEIDSWLGTLLAERPAALAVHLRTRKELSNVPAHWELMPRIVALRDRLSPETRIIGNGDVRDIMAARQKARETGCDGVMLGRAIYGNPWLFASPAQHKESDEQGNKKHDDEYVLDTTTVKTPIGVFTVDGVHEQHAERSPQEKITALIAHLQLFDELLADVVNYAVMKKHFKAYIHGWDNAKDLRMRLMETECVDEAIDILEQEGFTVGG